MFHASKDRPTKAQKFENGELYKRKCMFFPLHLLHQKIRSIVFFETIEFGAI